MCEILKRIKNLGDGYIVSNQLEDLYESEDPKEIISKYKYVFVADNPGKEEKNGKEYLSNGNTKINFDNFLKNYLGIKRDECLILNKSLFQTEKTEDLAEKAKEDKSQQLIAKLIGKILKINKECKIVLLGWTDYFELDENAIFHKFYTEINSFVTSKKMKERFLAFSHPSRRQLFTLKEQKIIENEISSSTDRLKFFIFCGQKQFLSRMPKTTFENLLSEFKAKK